MYYWAPLLALSKLVLVPRLTKQSFCKSSRLATSVKGQLPQSFSSSHNGMHIHVGILVCTAKSASAGHSSSEGEGPGGWLRACHEWRAKPKEPPTWPREEVKPPGCLLLLFSPRGQNQPPFTGWSPALYWAPHWLLGNLYMHASLDATLPLPAKCKGCFLHRP